MSIQQKQRIANRLQAAGLKVTKEMLNQLFYERAHRRDEDRFIFRRIPVCE